ncbi:MAG: acyltransferase [Bacteroidota bacterium]
MWQSLSLKIQFDKNRVYGLDILRAFAVILIVITHGMSYTPTTFNKIIEAVYLDGVSIFFVLSGFLIGRILIKTMSSENIDFYTLLNFWSRRWLRTLPLYFFILSAIIFCYNYNQPPGPTFKRFYIFSQNIYTSHPAFFIEAWSLSVEEWFYLLIPLLLFVFVKFFKIKTATSIAIISIAILSFSTILRIERYFDNLPITPLKQEMLFRMQVITRLDSLMYGVLAAFISSYNNTLWIVNKGYKLIAGLLILVINKLLTQIHQTEILVFYNTIFQFSFNAIGTAFLLPYLSNYKTGKGAIFKTITYISLISYSIYLINLTPMQDYIIPFINNFLAKIFTNKLILKNIDIVIFYVLIFPLSVYSYKLIESPFINLRSKFTFGKKASAPII